MCVAIHAPATAELIPVEDFELMRQENGDGMGMMYAENGKLKVIRQLRRVKRFWAKYKRLHEKGLDVVIHFRLATHGDKTLRNVHPIHVSGNLALVHNGIFSGFSQKDIRSDTRQFVDTVLKQLPDGWYTNDKAWELISYTTSGSKLIFMDANGTVKIMHEKDGSTVDGNWYSNRYWKWSYTHDYYTGYNHHRRGLSRWWQDDEGDYHIPISKVPEKDESVVSWNGEVASGAFLHWPTGRVVCESCRKEVLGMEADMYFQTLWDDGEPIVCDVCDRCVNHDTMLLLAAGSSMAGEVS